MPSEGERFTLTADGTTATYSAKASLRLSLTGGFGGGTAKLQAVDPAGNFVDVANGAFTSATDTIFDFPEQTQVRVDISGSTTPTLVVWFQG